MYVNGVPLAQHLASGHILTKDDQGKQFYGSGGTSKPSTNTGGNRVYPPNTGRDDDDRDYSSSSSSSSSSSGKPSSSQASNVVNQYKPSTSRPSSSSSDSSAYWQSQKDKNKGSSSSSSSKPSTSRPSSSSWLDKHGAGSSLPSSSSSSNKTSGKETAKQQDSIWNRFASGTKSVPFSGLSLVGEEGPELRLLNQGDGIIPTDMTENLMAWGMLTPSELLSRLPEFETTDFSSGGEVYQINFESLVLPDVTDFESFKVALTDNARNIAIQVQSQRQ